MEVKVNTGVLFKNERKEAETHADYTGSWVDDDGTEYYLNAWKNTSKAGKSYLKITRGKVKQQGAAPAPAKKHAPVESFDDEDLPF